MTKLGKLFAAAVLVCSQGCGPSTGPAPLKEKAQLIVDRDSIGFSQEFGSGTRIGTAPQESIKLENGGKEDLVISTVTYSGDGAFKMNGPEKKTLGAREFTFIQTIFTPTADKVYSGTITIMSNAENAPTKTIGVSGRGIDGGI
jgi:hypothetical protein